MIQNVDQIQTLFQETFDYPSDLCIKAPGRINLLGEHTDYNNGLVLPAAINKSIFFAFSLNNKTVISLHAKDLGETIEVNINETNRLGILWVDYLIGILNEIRLMGVEVKGFDCVFGGNLSIGSGMSSSSALECGFLEGINQLYQLNLDKWKLINISKSSNHNFLGIKGGIMDQFTCLFGLEKHFVLLDCNDFSYDYVPCANPSIGFLLVNSMERHNTQDEGYSSITSSFKEILKKVQLETKVGSLREINTEYLKSFKQSLSAEQFGKLQYLIEENDRVLMGVEALKQNDFNALGQLMYASHQGLANQLFVSTQKLDNLVMIAEKIDGVHGARMMGAGFGGCTLNLIESKKKNVIISQFDKLSYQILGESPEIYDVSPQQGLYVSP